MISLIHKTIFVHIPKCAGQSVESTFLKDISPDLNHDSHRHLLGCFEKPPSWDAAYPSRLAHLTAAQYTSLAFVSQSQWDSYFKFSTIRDPIERCVSMWRYHLYTEMSFPDFINEHLPSLSVQNDWYRSQSHYLIDTATGSCLVDVVLPFSQIAERWHVIQQRAGVRAALDHRNEARVDRPEVPPALARKIKKIYADDYLHFASLLSHEVS
jgi:hypothetical protein